MHQSDKPKFAQAMTVLGEIYSKEISTVMIGVYFSALEKYPVEEVTAAIQAHTRDTENGQWFPKPADLIRHLEGSSEGNALQAWAKVVKAIGSVGRYNSVAFDDPAMHKVIDEMGGWSKMCSTDFEEMPFKANEFTKRYRALARFGFTDYPRILIGESDAHNMSQGFQKEPQPVMYGDQQKCLLTLQGGVDSSRLALKSAATPVSKLLEMAAGHLSITQGVAK